MEKTIEELQAARRELGLRVDEACREITLLRAENAALKGEGDALEADLCWHPGEPERGYGSVAGAVDEADGYSIVEISRAACLPSVFAVPFAGQDGTRLIATFDSRSGAEQFLSKVLAKSGEAAPADAPSDTQES